MDGSTALAACACATTLIDQDRAQSSGFASNPMPVAMPALEQNRSIGPNARSLAATSSATCASSATSAAIAVAWPPSAVISSAMRSAASWSTSDSTTPAAPSTANLRASAAPMPPAAPVITATLPSSRIVASQRCVYTD